MRPARHTRFCRSIMAALFLVSAGAALYTSGAAAKGTSDAGIVAAPTIVDYPKSIASTGDSITRAFNTGGTPFTDAPANSWSTGTNSAVMSHYSTILVDQPLINGHYYNDAVTGAKMAGLDAQMSSVVTQGVEYVTVLLGANDACTSTEAQMTSVATYRAQFQTAMNTVTGGLPDARIYILSVPDIYNLWYILKDSSSARSTWNLYGICQSMLANPLSTDPADVDRRNRVRQRVVDYNSQLAAVCATSVHCRFDNNATYNAAFVPSDVSTRDYFHPSLAGQAKIAVTSYAAGYDFRDGVKPSSALSVLAKQAAIDVKQRPITDHQVAITARDNVGVAGIEYKLNGGPYTRYTGDINVPDGSTLLYRAVDVNGNSEAAKTFVP